MGQPGPGLPARMPAASARLTAMCHVIRPHSSPAQDYGNPERSGKMQVLAKVLRHWHEAGHK